MESFFLLISKFLQFLLFGRIWHKFFVVCATSSREQGVEYPSPPPHGTRALLIYVACTAPASWFWAPVASRFLLSSPPALAEGRQSLLVSLQDLQVTFRMPDWATLRPSWWCEDFFFCWSLQPCYPAYIVSYMNQTIRLRYPKISVAYLSDGTSFFSCRCCVFPQFSNQGCLLFCSSKPSKVFFFLLPWKLICCSHVSAIIACLFSLLTCTNLKVTMLQCWSDFNLELDDNWSVHSGIWT